MRSEAIQDTGAAQRLFIAVPVPEAVKEEMEKAQSELRPALPRECVRWTKRAQFHLTLKFLGDVESPRVGDLAEAIRGVSAGFPALQLRAERIGVFPDLRYPRVIWAWVHDEREQLPKLQQAIETAAGKFTAEKPEHKFTGHVTLARCQAIKRPQAEIIAKLAHGMTTRFFGEWIAGEVELIRSELLPGGSRYTVVASAPLVAKAPAEESFAMSAASDQRSADFLKISGQFKLGALVTESSHPVTTNLSKVAEKDIEKALDLLFEVDGDVVKKYRQFAASDRAGVIQQTVLRALKKGGRIFFTGCGSTGRLSIQLVSIWRDFWQREADRTETPARQPQMKDWENRAFSVMAGGDYALIKSVEGFEDFAAFGKKQISDLGVSDRDVVFAITEGGETSFVIGTAWRGVEAGAKVYFIYNNPDDVLCRHVERSREVIEDPRIEKLNLTTGPMAITGSTRMQATSIQLCVLLTILEMVARDLVNEAAAGVNRRNTRTGGVPPIHIGGYESSAVPAKFLARLVQMHAALRSPEVRSQLAQLVALEESVYRAGQKNNYYADRFGIDVLTDTTERSPTYCTPPFRKFDDTTATESWSFLFLPDAGTPRAWEWILKREPRCVEWSGNEVRELVGEEKAARTHDIVRKISRAELMRFKIGGDGMDHRQLGKGDSAIGVLSEAETESWESPEGFHRRQLEAAGKAGAKTGLIYFGAADALTHCALPTSHFSLSVPMPRTDFLLDGVTRVGVKMLLNALSTCTMVRLGRVMGNYMIWVVPSNLKLIDRATRYVQKLAGLSYEESNRLLFEVIEYVEPRMKADQAYPPVVGVAVLRARHGLDNEAAEQRLV